MFLAKIRKNIIFFHLKILVFTAVELQYVTWACFRNDLNFHKIPTSVTLLFHLVCLFFPNFPLVVDSEF